MEIKRVLKEEDKIQLCNYIKKSNKDNFIIEQYLEDIDKIFKRNNKKEDIVICIENNRIIGGFLLYYDDLFSNSLKILNQFSTLDIFLLEGNTRKVINNLLKYAKKNYDNFIYFSSFSDESFSGILNKQILNIELLGLNDFVLYMKENANYLNTILKSYFNDKEKKCLSNFNINNVKYEYLSQDKFREKFLKRNRYIIPFDIEEDNFLNFYYFTPYNVEYIENQNINYLIALYDDCVIGIIKIQFNDVYGKLYNTFNFIDINKNFKNKGISKNMIIELNKVIDKKYPLLYTSLSEEGKKCKIDKLLKKYISNIFIDLLS